MTGRTFWDGVARRYAARPVRDETAYETTLTLTRSYLGEDDKVLELGCGTGTTALKLAPAVAHLIAADISSEMVAIAREKLADHPGANVEFRQADAFYDAFAPGTFDAVLAFNLLHLLDDMEATIRRVRALLRPGGVFISKTVCLGRNAWHFRALISGLQMIGKAPPVKFLDIADLEKAIRAQGFEILETGNYPAKPPSRFIVARKV
ncbi:class I SAM-dependent methyltransferase [uncultured Roseovarius sp.]|uniref:class I SAM-dependent methyltransferase n=1 Tax=uncultured Roseovarius sp. TaxID=293344 RepID=UPI00259A9945|nr:class I SAM-dependent methyltransferase [uncultured Roseovarius sp.]